jgi:hypothetical protein
MRKLMLAVAIVVLPFSSVAAEDELAGTYKLISSTRKILDTGEVLDTSSSRGSILHDQQQ